MIVLFDAGILIKLVSPHTPGEQQQKLEQLLLALQKMRTQVLIPAPALAEFYVKARPNFLLPLRSTVSVAIAPFDEKAAIECAFSIREALRSHDKKAPQINSPWQKVKFDHQIVAIAKSKGAGVIYSEDAGLRKFAQSVGVAALCIADLN